MLDIYDFEKISQFKDKLNKHHFLDNKNKSFRSMCSIALKDTFNFNSILFGYIENNTSKKLTTNTTSYNLSTNFCQDFFSSNFINDPIFINSDSDIFIYSTIPNYMKRTFYKDVLTKYGYSDFLVFYLTVNDKYTGYIVIFKEFSKGLFSKKDNEIVSQISDYIAVEYYNYINFIKLKVSNDSLLTQTDFYPIGIIMLKNNSDVTFINETAKEFIAELGIKSPQFFEIFYSNTILPSLKYEISLSRKHIVRFGGFIFSIVRMNSVSEDYIEKLENARTNHSSGEIIDSFRDTIKYIYMVRDELNSVRSNNDNMDNFSFTNKENDISKLILAGKDNKQISDELGISINTVRVHIQNIYKKTNSSNKTELLFKLNNIIE